MSKGDGILILLGVLIVFGVVAFQIVLVIAVVFGVIYLIYSLVAKNSKIADEEKVKADDGKKSGIVPKRPRRTITNTSPGMGPKAKLKQEAEDADDQEEDSTIPEEYYDKRQDLLDFIAVVDTLAKYKNRYSALQNSTYVARLLIDEYEESGSDEDFFDFVMNKCRGMYFDNATKGPEYKMSEEIVKSLKSGASPSKVSKQIIDRTTGRTLRTSRPDPEEIYPISQTGNPQIDKFVKIARILLHTKVSHLSPSEKECNKEVDRIVKQYKPREEKDFNDFFTKAFQFGYLNEPRFQELYFMLFNVAESLKEGLSETEVIRRIKSVYAEDKVAKPRFASSEAIEQVSAHEDNDESIPYYSFTNRQHMMVTLASRVSRECYSHKLFRKTSKLTVDLINRFHQLAPSEQIGEKAYYTFSIVTKRKEQKKLASVYNCILQIVELSFDGKTSPEQAWEVLSSGEIKDILPVKKEKSVATPQPRPNGSPQGKKHLINTIYACNMTNLTEACVAVTHQLDERLDAKRPLEENEYYKDLLRLLKGQHKKSQVDMVLIYILQCKINNVPDVSFPALMVSQFPGLYTKTKRNTRSR